MFWGQIRVWGINRLYFEQMAIRTRGRYSSLAFGFKLYLSILQCLFCDLLILHTGGFQEGQLLEVSKDFIQ